MRIQGNIIELAWNTLELALNGILFSRIRVPTQMKTFRIEYNYNLGIDTRMIRYVISLFLVPSIVNHFQKYQHLLNFLLGCFMCFDIFLIIDILMINETLYAITIFLRIIHILDSLIRTVKSLLTIRLKEQMKKRSVQSINQNQSPKSIIISPTQSTSNTTTIEDSHDELLNTQKKQTNNIFFQFNLKTSRNTKIMLQLDDPSKFDSIFDNLKLEPRVLLMVKLNLCSQLYLSKSIKLDKNQLQEKIANYQASLLFTKN